ncbi:MAG: hypothetical protein HY718_00550 [Planctomycetes bacterium]|nr:hypothetical protein [Planctomycetota bacterium]
MKKPETFRRISLSKRWLRIPVTPPHAENEPGTPVIPRHRTATVPRIAVLGSDSPGDPFSLFFKQLGWLEPERPTTALIFARSQFDFTRYLPTLKKLDSTSQGAVGLIVATTGGAMSVPAEWSTGRQLETVLLPSGYLRLVEVVMRCSRAIVPGLTTATAR